MTTVICPVCGHKNPRGSMNCEKCRINLAWALQHPEEVAEKRQERGLLRLGLSVCPHCGKEVSARLKLCPHCGTKLTEHGKTGEVQEHPTTRQGEESTPSQEQPNTIICPSCGSINPYTADECLKCGLALELVREALGKASVPSPAETPVASALKKPKQLVSKVAEPPSRGVVSDIGQCVDSRRFLLRGMADKAEEIKALFFEELDKQGIEGLSVSRGEMIVEDESRDYYFAERDLGKGAVAVMAVRIVSIDTDTFVEWRHFELPSLKEPWIRWLKGGIGCLTVFYIFGIFLILDALEPRAGSLTDSQSQDSTALQLAVRTVLEEAIDLADISKELIQAVEKEPRKVI